MSPLFPRWRSSPALPGLSVVLAALVGTLPARGAEPSPPDPGLVRQAAELVRKLGDVSFGGREQAADELKRIGIPALEPLRGALRDSDPEIRYRVRRLLDVIEQHDLEQRLVRFLEDPDVPPDDALPGWKRYREQIGYDRPARQLFVAMQRAEPELFRAMQAGPRDLSGTFEQRCQEFQFWLAHDLVRSRLASSVPALLFAATDPRVSLQDNTSYVFVNFLNQNELRTALTSGESKAPLRRMVGTWIAKPGGSTNITYQQMMLALQLEIPEGIEPAFAILKQNGANYYRQYALLAIGRFGTREHVAQVEKYVSDKTLVTGAAGKGAGFRSEVGDVALAIAAHLSGQPLEQYGFKTLQKQPMYLFMPNTIGFADDAARDASRKRWTEWRTANPDKPADKPVAKPGETPAATTAPPATTPAAGAAVPPPAAPAVAAPLAKPAVIEIRATVVPTP